MTRAATGMALVLAAALGAWQPARAAEPVAVLATVGMIGDLAAEVGGDCARVAVLIGPGNDPHLYQPRASDIARLQGAEVVFHVGLNLEGGRKIENESIDLPAGESRFGVVVVVVDRHRSLRAQVSAPDVWRPTQNASRRRRQRRQ